MDPPEKLGIHSRHRQYQYQVLRYWGFEWYWYWYWYWGFQFCWYWYWYWYWGSEVLKYWGIEIWCGIGIESDQIPAASRFQRFKIIQMSFHIACKDMFLLFKGSVWVLSCTFKLPLWLKAFSQLEQANGFSPVWVLSCSFKWALFQKVLLHLEQALSSVGPFMHLQITTLVKSFFTFGTGK